MRWSDLESVILRNMWEEGFSVAQIASALELTTDAVTSKATRMGLDKRRRRKAA